MGRDTTRKARDKRKRESAKLAKGSEIVRDFENPRRADEAHQWADAQYQNLARTLTEGERDAVMDYRRGDMMGEHNYDRYYFEGMSQSEVNSINKRLIRELSADPYSNDITYEHTKALLYDQLSGVTRRQSINESVYLYRGESRYSPTYEALERGDINEGDTIRRGNFTSTGIVTEPYFYDPGAVKMKIKAPKGSRMLYVDTIAGSTWQYEMILPPRTGLKITNITRLTDFRGKATYEIEAEIVDDGSKA